MNYTFEPDEIMNNTETEDTREFRIDNDKTADWAIQAILKEEAERDRLLMLADEQIKDLQEKKQLITERCERSTETLRFKLFEFFDSVEAKETKTQFTYKLLSGTLILRKGSAKLTLPDRNALVERLIEAGNSEFIKTITDVDWAAYKKNLRVEGDVVIDTSTGELVTDVAIEPIMPELRIRGDK